MMNIAGTEPTRPSRSPLEHLICGSACDTDSAIEDESVVVLKGLSKLVICYYDFSLEYKQDLSKLQSSYFLPVALRSLMESSAIALLARIDPLRVLLSSKSQSSTSYNKAAPQASALKWKDDVMGDHEKTPSQNGTGNAQQNNPSPTRDTWDPSMSSGKLPRNLFSRQMCEAFWEPAAKNLANASNSMSSTWLAELQNQTPSDLPKKLIGEGKQIYSELSKGIHPEFAVRRESEFDSPTLQTYLERTMKWTASLGLLSHCAATFSARIPLEYAMVSVKSIEDVIK